MSNACRLLRALLAAGAIVPALPAAGLAQSAPAAYAYDEIDRSGVENTADAAPGRFDADEARLRAAIRDGDVISGEALAERLRAAQRRLEKAQDERTKRDAAGGGFLGGLLSLLPGPARALANAANGGGIGALLGALPGAGGAIAGEVFSLVPGVNGSGSGEVMARGRQVRSVLEESRRLADAAQREQRLGHLTHVTVAGSSYRTDDVAGMMSVIVDRERDRWITVDHLRKTYHVESITEQDPFKKLAPMLALSARRATRAGGTVVTVHHVMEGAVLHDGPLVVHEYVDHRDPQSGPAACRPDAKPVTTTLRVADLPAPQTVDRDRADELTALAAAGGCTYTHTYDGPTPPGDRFVLYFAFAGPEGTTIVQERGHVTTLDPEAARPLLDVPAGYREE